MSQPASQLASEAAIIPYKCLEATINAWNNEIVLLKKPLDEMGAQENGVHKHATPPNHGLQVRASE